LRVCSKAGESNDCRSCAIVVGKDTVLSRAIPSREIEWSDIRCGRGAIVVGRGAGTLERGTVAGEVGRDAPASGIITFVTDYGTGLI
jgi:hypothetical protein